MKSATFDILVCISLLLAGATVGFFIGRATITVSEKTVIEYKDMPTVSVSVTPKPVKWSVPDVPQLIWRTDTVTDMQVVDTAAILADWIMKREYSGRLIDDTTGTVEYSAVVQYNQLQDIGVNYTPRQRTQTTTRTIERLFIPFVMAGYNTAGYGSIGAGAFVGDFGLAVEVGGRAGESYIGGKVAVRF